MYTKDNPFFSTLKEKRSLCRPGSSKKTMHVVLDLKDTALPYRAGDSAAIFPENSPRLIQKTLKAMKATGEELVVDKRTSHEILFKDLLARKASITHFSRKLLNEVAQRAGVEIEDPKQHIREHQVWDLLERFPSVSFSAQELADLLMPLLPRFYSIASSPLAAPCEIHLTVAHLKYYTNEEEREGVCTDYLCEQAPLGSTIPLYIQPSHHFALPQDGQTPLIMVGPGTGVAPFRAFMQERELSGADGEKIGCFLGKEPGPTNFFMKRNGADGRI